METNVLPVLALFVVSIAFSAWACFRARADRELRPGLMLLLILALYLIAQVPLILRYA